MTYSEKYFQVNSPNVISEIIEGEAVLVNLDNGIYYSMDQVGANVWELIESGKSADQIVNVILARYEGNPYEMENGVRQLINSLQTEKLITPVAEPSTGHTQTENPFDQRETIEKIQFKEPVLNIYTDMEELLLLDPIHEVDDTGWPNPQLNDN